MTISNHFHLNESKLHLNKKGNTVFVSNFRRYLNNLNWREPVGDKLTVYSGKTKSFECLNNKSDNDPSVSHNTNELIKKLIKKMSIILLLLKLT